MKQKKLSVMTRMALCITLMCVASYLVVPLPFSPAVLSLHTVAVNLVGLTLGRKHAAGAILIYLLMGLIGLPVFSGGTAGAGKLFGPTGGFYIGFLPSVSVISLLVGGRSSFGCYVLATLVGMCITHLCAVVMMALHNGFQWQAAFLAVSLPFVAGDVLKCLLSAAVGMAIKVTER